MVEFEIRGAFFHCVEPGLMCWVWVVGCFGSVVRAGRRFNCWLVV